MSFQPRWRPTVTLAGGFLWLAIALLLTWPPLSWHLNYFEKPGPHYRTLVLVLVTCLSAVLLVYGRVRRKTIWRHEPALITAALAAGCLFYQPAATLLAIWLFVSSYLTGRWCLRQLQLEPGSHAVSIALATGTGLGVLVCVLFLLGLLHAYLRWTFALLLVLPIAVFHRYIACLTNDLGGLLRQWASTPEMSKPLLGVVMPFAAISGVLGMLVWLAPSIGFDAIHYHLPAVQYYSAAQSLEAVPGLDYSYHPQAIETVMTLAYSLAGQPAAQLVHPIFFVLMMLMTYGVARRCGLGRMPAVAGVIVGSTIPFIHWTGSIVKNDQALSYFLLASLYCYLRGRKSGNSNWLRLGAFQLAMGFGVKHVAIFGAIPLGVLYLQALWRRPDRRRLAAELAVILLGCGLWWHLRTFLLTGSPVYPFEIATAVEQWQPMEGSPRPALPVLFVQYPWITHFQGRRSFESPSPNPCGVFLVLFWPLWLFVRRRPALPQERACLLFIALYFLYWGYVWAVLRYFIVPLMLLIVFTTARLFWLHEHSGRVVRGTIQAALAYSFIFAMLVTMLLEVNAPQLRLFAGQLDTRGYLRQAVAGFPSLEYLQAHATPHDRILSVNNCARLYAPNVTRLDCVESINSAAAQGEVLERLKETDYAFVILPSDWPETFFDALVGPARVERCYGDGHYAVYELCPLPPITRAIDSGLP